jgi:GGDEF domain-containing protein
MGIALLNDPNMTASILLAQADTAMYAAKMSGKNNYRFFDPIMQQKSEQQATN